MSAGDSIALAGTLIAAAAIFLGLFGIRRQLQVAVFLEYTRRYSEVLANYEIQWQSESFPLDSLTPEEHERVIRVMRRFFNMFSEEFYLHELRKLDPSTWRIWQDGIRQSMGSRDFMWAWQEVKSEYRYHPRFQAFIDNLGSRGLAQEG